MLLLLLLGVFCLTCPSVLKGRRHDAADAGMLLLCCHTCSSLLKRGGHDAADAGGFLPHVPMRAERQVS